MNKTERIQTRIAPELKAKLKELADAENKTITSYLEYLIEKELEKKEG